MAHQDTVPVPDETVERWTSLLRPRRRGGLALGLRGRRLQEYAVRFPLDFLESVFIDFVLSMEDHGTLSRPGAASSGVFADADGPSGVWL